MRAINIVLILMTFGCGIKVKHSVDGKVQGNINHNVSFSLDEIEKAFYNQCKSEHPTYTEEQLQTCKNEKVTEFLDFMGQGLQNGNNDSTSS